MQAEERERRVKARYRELKAVRPDLYERAAQIASLVMIQPDGATLQQIAVKVEEAIVSVLLEEAQR